MRINKFTYSLILESIKIGDYIDAGLNSGKVSNIEKKNHLDEMHYYFELHGNNKTILIIK